MNASNDMDSKLRQLENQSLPDLSKQDQHWQEMTRLLTPASLMPKTANSLFQSSKLLIAGGVALIILLFAIKQGRKKTIVQPIATTEQINGQKQTPKVAEPIVTIQPVVPDTKPVEQKIKKQALVVSKKEKVYATMVNAHCKKCGTDWLNDTVTIKNIPATTVKKEEPAATLASFFAQLEKPSQEFVIDNNKDTVLNGQDGTSLLINAHTFDTKEKVTLTLKEYYSYQDIITNKLSTTSDGSQLVTGGMIHLTATVNGKEVSMQPAKSIKWFVPDTSAEIRQMRLFEGRENRNDASLAENENGINWLPTNQNISFYLPNMWITVLNLLDNHHSVEYDKYTTARYYIAKRCPLSNQEMKQELEKRYGHYYGRIKVRRLWWGNSKRTFLSNNSEYPVVGDSINVMFDYALKQKLISKEDSIKYCQQSKKDSLNTNSLNKLSCRYNLNISTLGWINCDRFYNDSRPKVPLYVDLKDTASNYITLLVFDKMRSMMTGLVSGNKVVFPNIPEGETAKIICVGIKNGKAVTAIEPVTISRTTLNGMKFEETTPSAFRETVGLMDK